MSVEATIIARVEVRGAIYELVALWEDYRLQVVGGTIGAISTLEICIIPSLMNNASVWVGITEKQYKELDNFQYELVRALLQVPGSTPLACLRAATGMMAMKWRVWEQKLLLVLDIQGQEDTVLAKLVFEEQVSLGLPELTSEVSDICLSIRLPDICSTDCVTKQEIRECILYNHLQSLKEELATIEKGSELAVMDIREPQEYLTNTSLAEARMAFRVRYIGRMGCMACLKGKEEGGTGLFRGLAALP